MKTNSRCIFLLGFGKFDHPYETASFMLAKEFAKNNHRVYYIEYPFTVKDIHKLKNSDRYKIRKDAFMGKNDGIIETSDQNLKIVVIPPLLSIHFLPESKLYRRLLQINEKRIAKTINNIVSKEAIDDFIFFNSWVFHYPNVATHINASRRVYHCVDPLIMPYDAKHGIVSEKQLVENSDIVICTSKQLYDEKRKVHPKTHFVPNAADIKHSLRAVDPNLQGHISMLQFKKPVIGYFGNIEKRIDYEMIKEVAEKNQDKNFVFAGPVQKQWVPDFFFNLPNVHLIGRIPYNEMPNVVKFFDVAIIPFRKYENSATVFPIKLFEYLGAGKPVVSTDFNPDLQNFTHDLVYYCSDAIQFSEALNHALINNAEFLQKQRIKLASQHTWEKRAATIEELISNS